MGESRRDVRHDGGEQGQLWAWPMGQKDRGRVTGGSEVRATGATVNPGQRVSAGLHSGPRGLNLSRAAHPPDSPVGRGQRHSCICSLDAIKPFLISLLRPS